MAETLHKSDLKDKNGENNGRKAGIDRWTQYFEQGIFRDPDLTNSEGLHTNAVYDF